MEQTMGKRIGAYRRQLGLTQEALAERLGVTAQAVSKWENDQSCPDITMLPKLAEIFSVTTDELLGIEKKVYEAQVMEEENIEENKFTIEDEGWKMSWSSGKKGTLGLALWILLAGGLLLASNILGWGATLWGVLWPTALLVFGLFGLWPKFSFLRLGCALFGGYFTWNALDIFPAQLDKSILLPLLLLLLGLSLLADALKRKDRPVFSFSHGGKNASKKNYKTEGERFDCSVSFGELRQEVLLSRLSGGEAQASFGELELDLTKIGEIAPDCRIDVSCSFGEMKIRVPRDYIAEPSVSTSFASVETTGRPNAGASGRIQLIGSVSFGELEIEYV